MKGLPGQPASLWMETGGESAYPPLTGEPRVDVAVVGAGMTGVVAAVLLKEAGATVALVDSRRVAAGVTGFTTAKVSSLHGTIYDSLTSSFGEDGARAYGEANEAALAWIAEQVTARGIDCDFRRRDNYTYAAEESSRETVEKEAEAAIRLGLPAAFVEDVPLPYPVAGAVRFADQAEFHPRKFLLALAATIPGGGSHVFEDSRVTSIDDGNPCRVEAEGGAVVADHVVVATHFPIVDRSLAFARIHPERSYCLAARIAGEPPEGMFISADSPTRSVRAHSSPEGTWLIVGGEGHKVGQAPDTDDRYRHLADFANEHWDVTEIEYRWSTQDNMSVDGVPLVGKATPISRRLYIATGYAKWGLTNGTAAAMILADAILGRENPWASTFASNRFKPLAGGKDFVKENLNVATRFVGDRLTKGAGSLADLARGEGMIVRHEGERVAAYRDEDGGLHAVSPVCTHLACHVTWNRAERSWDCPCHGSRFDVDGRVLQGPAVRDLESKPVT